jgi:hypothetical protein
MTPPFALLCWLVGWSSSFSSFVESFNYSWSLSSNTYGNAKPNRIF